MSTPRLPYANDSDPWEKRASKGSAKQVPPGKRLPYAKTTPAEGGPAPRKAGNRLPRATS